MYSYRILFLIISLLISSLTFASEAGDKAFQQGLAAFKQKQYTTALKAFKKAERAGLQTGQLYYNLGVTHFKLEQYTAAQRAFRKSSRSKKLRQLAFYNLGLVAEKQGDKQTAIHWFKRAIEDKPQSKIARLAEAKLSSATGKAEPSWYGRLSIGPGYDDNVTLVTTGSPTLRDDTYLETFVYAGFPLAQETNFIAIVDWQDYSDIDSSDFFLLSGAINHKISYSDWQLIPEFTLSQSRLDSKSYQTIANLKFSASTRISKTNRLMLRYRYSDIQSDDQAYDYLQGQRHQFRTELIQQLDSNRLYWRYQLELNDRENLPTTNYSPTRHTLRIRLKHRLNETLTATGSLEYRRSDYEAVAGFSRSDDRYRIRAEGNYDINKDWSARLRYTYTDNDSNLPAEVYDRNDIQLLAQLRF